MFLKHECYFIVSKRSNIVQFDSLGYPLRLCILECKKCKKTTQEWIDSEMENGDIELKWEPTLKKGR